MLTPDTLNAFVQRDTRTVANALVDSQLLGTQAGDAVLAAARNYPGRYRAIVAALKRRNAWEAAA